MSASSTRRKMYAATRKKPTDIEKTSFHWQKMVTVDEE
jgi:hypothetical protein